MTYCELVLKLISKPRSIRTRPRNQPWRIWEENEEPRGLNRVVGSLMKKFLAEPHWD